MAWLSFSTVFTSIMTSALTGTFVLLISPFNDDIKDSIRVIFRSDDPVLGDVSEELHKVKEEVSKLPNLIESMSATIPEKIELFQKYCNGWLPEVENIEKRRDSVLLQENGSCNGCSRLRFMNEVKQLTRRGKLIAVMGELHKEITGAGESATAGQVTCNNVGGKKLAQVPNGTTMNASPSESNDDEKMKQPMIY